MHKFARSRVELQGITQQGRTIHLEATRSTDATTNQTVLMVYDITERKRMNWICSNQRTIQDAGGNQPHRPVDVTASEIQQPWCLDLMGIRMEDEVYDEQFTTLFHEDDQAVLKKTSNCRTGERPPYREVRMNVANNEVVEVGVRMTLSFDVLQPFR